MASWQPFIGERVPCSKSGKGGGEAAAIMGHRGGEGKTHFVSIRQRLHGTCPNDELQLVETATMEAGRQNTRAAKPVLASRVSTTALREQTEHVPAVRRRPQKLSTPANIYYRRCDV